MEILEKIFDAAMLVERMLALGAGLAPRERDRERWTVIKDCWS